MIRLNVLPGHARPRPYRRKLKCTCGECKTCKFREHSRRWRANNPVGSIARTRRYQQRKKPEVLSRARERRRERLREDPFFEVEHSRKYRDRNIVKVRWLYFKRRNPEVQIEREAFVAWFNAHAAACAGCCEWCGEPFAGKREPYVDHNHETGELRALLCCACNTIEGFARSPEHLERIAAKLREHEQAS